MLLASVVLLSTSALGRSPATTSEAASNSRSLLERVGLERAEAWLDGEEAERLLAIARLASADSPRALRLLDRWLEDASHWSDAELLAVARSLAPRANEPIAQRWLFRILTGATPQEKGALPRASHLIDMARQVAALGLAASGDVDATSLLAKLLRRQTPASAIASVALLAHPPEHLAPVLSSPGPPTVLLAQTLERLGDQRAFTTLRNFVRRGAPEIQAAAAVALLRLGHLETVELAEHWLTHRREPLPIVAATAEILLTSRSSSAGAAYTRLVELAPRRAIDLLHRQPSAAAAQQLVARWQALPRAVQESALFALGRSATDDALRLLAEQLTNPAQATAAALALAQSPADAAGEHLRAALAHEQTQLLAARALVLRATMGFAVPSELRPHLAALSRSERRLEAFVGVWGLSALDEQFAIERVLHGTPLHMRAAASTALRHGSRFLQACALRLRDAQDPAMLSVALLDEHAARQVPTAQLLRWADSASPLRLIAIARLAQRDDPRQQARIDGFLRAPDLASRAAAHLGFGRHPATDASATLVRALRQESQPSVRQAIVVALSQRPPHELPPQVLPDAARFDPDANVRALAKLAMTGAPLSASPSGTEVAWLDLRASQRVRGAVLLAPGALPVYLAAAPDGQIPLVGLRHSGFRVRPVPAPNQ